MNDVTAEILFPDRSVPLAAGEEVVVREFRFLESLRATPMARPIIDDLAALFGRAAEPETVPLLDVLETFAAHPDAVMALLKLATGRDDIAVMSPADGHRLLQALWEVNEGFFTELTMAKTMRAASRSDSEPCSLS